jgi:hypothetical protein
VVTAEISTRVVFPTWNTGAVGTRTQLGRDPSAYPR